jgi:hypothetical protein
LSDRKEEIALLCQTTHTIFCSGDFVHVFYLDFKEDLLYDNVFLMLKKKKNNSCAVSGQTGLITLSSKIKKKLKSLASGFNINCVQFAALGGFILLFGFLAFNGGSELAISGKMSAANMALAVVNTIISGSAAAFTVMIIQRSPLFGHSRWSLLSTLNGALAGMVNKYN